MLGGILMFDYDVAARRLCNLLDAFCKRNRLYVNLGVNNSLFTI